ncbi:VIR protein [Plasmodium vivax]|uniref:VIR protein n=1 Tax=Plasmodium vivax TaxID=5855 RepID=A0A1G4HC81_PLAVI|nr:VIR protein [Plasmodium vivax]
MANETRTCPEKFYKLDGCTSYFYSLYNLYPSEFEIKHIDFLKRIKDFPDPILKYVALYFYYNYSVAKDYFNGKSGQNDLACHNLNRWLDQHKSFFTHSEKCKYNTNQWNINIEPLWTMFEKYFGEKKCERIHVFSNTTQIPNELDSFTCNMPYPDDYICYNPLEKNDTKIKEDCDKLADLCKECDKCRLNQTCSAHANLAHQRFPDDGTFHIDAQAYCQTSCPLLIQTIALPVVATFLGTPFFAFFLYNLLLLDLYYLIEVEGKKDYNSSSWKKWHINNLKDLEITIHIREMEELVCITNLCKNKFVNISINIDFINKMV